MLLLANDMPEGVAIYSNENNNTYKEMRERERERES